MKVVEFPKVVPQEKLEVRFGAKLRQIRNEKDISQEALADKAGLTRSYIGRIDRGRINVSLATLYKLAEALEISPKELLP
ncbi:helix-turn-helix domain-containing protein [Thalassomonas actiniarum]|uniref:Helix-turn-helix transcriptional regulator n=1 Tax=Thalassomonas actiniarum TaxID=485447 RepID=A0AAF0C6E9_9GAMM|nr:helix-turn-helix transcriptional regulator [Thalassomonas actiniarum]WDE02548.1 helix-turn-helix transcriptional regulator [Thalassomonas actiniarum]